MRVFKFALLLLCILLTGSNNGFGADTLIQTNSYWRYSDDGSTPPANWTTLSFVDSAWSIGPAELGYGDGDEATVVSYGSDPNDKYITTYFRHEFFVDSVSNYKSLILHLKRDDGAIVYLNGSEVYRSNMPTDTVDFSTLSQSSAGGTEETNFVIAGIDLTLLQNGYNLISVELHQNSSTGSDASFDLALFADSTSYLMRGPYLQMATPNSMKVCWRTSCADISKILFGTSMAFSDSIVNATLKINHEINVTGLQPATKYYYALGSVDNILHSDSNTFFITPPVADTNQHIRIWAMGDFGIGSMQQDLTRNAYYNYTDTTYTNIFLMLGDNAYSVGSDENYTTQVFTNHYEDILKQTVVYSTCGNHELLTASSANQTGPYYDIFSFPKNGEGGGVPSGSEAYYSFNYGNVHFVCLESNIDSFGAANLSAMLAWLDSDLAANTKKWIIAYYHLPPLSKGYHDSDFNLTETWCRENINPVLEKYNVDLVLGGHSHTFERSHLLKGHFGISTTLLPSMIKDASGGGAPHYYNKSSPLDSGTVYAVVGSSSEITPQQSDWPHPAMFNSLSSEYGSMVIDVTKDSMNVKFITLNDSIADDFTFVKTYIPQISSIERGPYLQTAAPDEMTVRWTTAHSESTKILYGTSINYTDSVTDTLEVLDHTIKLHSLLPNTKYYYSIRLENDSLVGDTGYYFYTPPLDGTIQPVRIWALGDFGTNSSVMNGIKNSYYNYTGQSYTNLLLWLGNNAYPAGSSEDYDLHAFTPFKSILKNTCVYSTCGNIELANANALTATGDYYDIFNFPKLGEAGGLASNSESYYSFNYANIHFVSLESNIDSVGIANINPMLNWLSADLAANTQKWTVVLFHHPPYSKATFDSDVEANMISTRTIILPILETHNVDLILSSHSQNYERSVLLNGHYGISSTYNASTMGIDTLSGSPPVYYDKTSSMVKGTVCAVVGCLKDTSIVQPGWPHPVMYTSLNTTAGSLVIDVLGDTLNGRYLTSGNTVADHFAILKRTSTNTKPAKSEARTKLSLYPNPANSHLTIHYTGSNDEIIKLSIVDAAGRTVFNKEIHGKAYYNTIDISEFANGVYMVKLQGKKTQLNKRFVKE